MIEDRAPVVGELVQAGRQGRPEPDRIVPGEKLLALKLLVTRMGLAGHGVQLHVPLPLLRHDGAKVPAHSDLPQRLDN